MKNITPITGKFKSNSHEWLFTYAMPANETGQPINLNDLWTIIDFSEDNTDCVKWLVKNRLITQTEFRKIKQAREQNERIMDDLGFIPTQADHLVNMFIKQRQLEIDEFGLIYSQQGPIHELFDLFYDEYNDQHSVREQSQILHNMAGDGDFDHIYKAAKYQSRINHTELASILQQKIVIHQLGYRMDDVKNSINRWINKQKNQQRIITQSNIIHNGQKADEMWKIIDEEAFQDLPAPGFASKAIQKFMWQVKRKAAGLPVTYHNMVVITGARHGQGKSKFLEFLINPVKLLSKQTDFDMIQDQRNIDLWKNNILVFDEMAFIGKANIDALKRIITLETMTKKPLYSNTEVVVKQSATFIGTSNNSLGEMIYDPTGMRRFIELEWSDTIADKKWEPLKKIDWLLLWQSVDENGPDPMEDLKDILAKQQESNRAQTNIELWFEENRNLFKIQKSASDVYPNYREWEKDNAPGSLTNKVHFGRKLTGFSKTDQGRDLKIKMVNNKNYYYVED